MKYTRTFFATLFIINSITNIPVISFASYHFADFKAYPPIHVYKSSTIPPRGLTPDAIKKVYNLPTTGGHGTIAIIGAYDSKTLEADLAVFNKQFKLASCTIVNKCLEVHMDAGTSTDTGWAKETAFDVEWSHAIAPKAKILLVEAKTHSGVNLLKAVDYAASRKDVVAISLSWGGTEFSDETTLDSHFKSVSGATFFVSSGDSGAGVSWPAASPNVIAVGGTSLSLTTGGVFLNEVAWSVSGGGVSLYEKEPIWQKTFGIPKSKGMRAIPDVSYDADPKSGFPIYVNGMWYTVGGTSAGAPQWAAIQSLGLSITQDKIYQDKSSAKTSSYFRDIVSGSNGTCTYYCTARTHYDYVTGLGSPRTIHF